jgi:DNA-binding PadR family transcriptional regulator
MQHHHHNRQGFFFNRHRWAEGGETPFDFPFGRFGRRWRGFGQGERFFGRGDLKIVILELLKDQPRHGYDIIRALEDRARGFYRPSPGSVYPTLQLLEDLGYVTASQSEGKKVYSITDAGRAYLTEQESTADDIRSRIASGWDAASRPEVGELMRELQALARALFRQASRGAFGDPERLKRLRAIVERARSEVDAIGDSPAASSPEATTIV